MRDVQKNVWVRDLTRNWQLYLLLLLPVIYLIVFSYIPMGGLVIAFKDYSLKRGILKSNFVGLQHFRNFINTPNFSLLLKNTLALSVLSLVIGFPIPILLALLLNEVRNKFFKKSVQMITYLPYFISTVVMCGMLLNFLSLRTGMVNNVIELFGGQRVNFMGIQGWFRMIYVLSGVWQSAGYSAVLYIATLSAVDQSVVEASVIDGATRVKRVLHVDLPVLAPTVVIQLIMAIGGLMGVGFEKVFLLQNPVNMDVSETISTFVYKRGLTQFQYSYATAVGLFNSVVNLVLIVGANWVAGRVGGSSLW